MNLHKLKATPFIFISFSGFITLTALLILNLYSVPYYDSFFGINLKLTGTIIYSLCLAVCFVSFFTANKFLLYYICLGFLCIFNIVKGNEMVALLLFIIVIILLIGSSFYEKDRTLKMMFTFFFWTMLLLLLILENPGSMKRVIYFTAISYFSIGSFSSIYYLFKKKYNSSSSRFTREQSQAVEPRKLIAEDYEEDKTISLETVRSDYKLTKRQTECVRFALTSNSPLKTIARKFNVSESTIKKDMTEIYAKLGVNSRKDLKEKYSIQDFELINEEELDTL